MQGGWVVTKQLGSRDLKRGSVSQDKPVEQEWALTEQRTLAVEVAAVSNASRSRGLTAAAT